MGKANPKLELSIIIPCYNEAGNIKLICERLNAHYGEIQFELILVDNGSTDDTSQIIDDVSKFYSFVKKVSILNNVGYGNGILSGIAVSDADMLAYTHADLQTPPEDIIIGYKKIRDEKFDMSKILLKGIRLNRQKEDYFTYLLSKVVKILLGFSIEDINGQPKIFHKNLVETFVDAPSDSTFDAFVLYNAKVSNLELVTFPVKFENRAYGESHMGSTSIGKIKSGLSQIKSIYILSWNNRWQEQNLFWQLLRFAISGIITNVINYTTFILSLKIMQLHYMVSSILGNLVPFIFGFFLHRNFSFRSINPNIRTQLTGFFIVIIFSIILYSFTMFICVAKIGLSPEIGQIFAILVGAFINFVGLKYWVFPLENTVRNILNTWRD